MKRSPLCVASSIVAVVLLVAVSVRASETKSADPKTASPLVGAWQAESFSMSLDDGNRKTLNEQDRVGLFITDKTCTLRLARPILAKMSYIAQPGEKPDTGTLDLKSKDGEMLGIYRLAGDRLTISLNDKAKGRPADFDEKTNGMVLRLKRAYGVALYMIDADGRNLHKIAALPDYWYLAATDISSDGRKIAFNAWQAIVDNYCVDNHAFTCNLDGSDTKDLGWGSMPTFSPDGNQIACYQFGQTYQPQRGIWIMNADGTGRKLIAPDGTGLQWSPKRNEIAYSSNQNLGRVMIYDVAKKTSRLAPLEKDYSRIDWGVVWSPDGKWLCFKGERADGSGVEIAAVSAEEGKKDFKSILMVAEHPEIESVDLMLTCPGPNNDILFAMKTKTTKTLRLHILDFNGQKPPKLFPGIPDDWVSFDPACSRDGKKILFSSNLPHPPSKTAEKPESSKSK